MQSKSMFVCSGNDEPSHSLHSECDESKETEDAHQDVNAGELLANYSWMADADKFDQEVTLCYVGLQQCSVCLMLR